MVQLVSQRWQLVTVLQDLLDLTA